jgi:hypothetical protein
MFGGANGAAAIKILPTLDEFERVRKNISFKLLVWIPLVTASVTEW